jgi:hypothetical protein
LERKQSEKWQGRMSRTVNSAMCFSLAYVLLTYALWFTSGLAGRFYKFDSLVYYYGIKFILNGHGWSKMKVIAVYSAGAVSIFFLATLALFLYSNLKKVKTLFNVFFLWVFVIGLSIFLAQIIMASLGIYHYNSRYYQGLAVVFAWLKLPVFAAYILDVFAVLFVLYAGVNAARPFLAFSYSYSKVNNLDHRRKYFFEIALVPFIVGVLVSWVAVFPKDNSAKDVLVLLISTHLIYVAVIGTILGIAWLSLSYIEVNKQDLVRYNSLQMPNVVFMVLMFVAWALVYISLSGVYLSA